MNPLEFDLWLDALDGTGATFTTVEPTTLTFHIPRDLWLGMGRPANIRVQVTP